MNPIQLDCALRVPSQYIPLSHLTSRKSLLVYEKERYFKHLHSPLSWIAANLKLGERRAALHGPALEDENAISNVPEERQACGSSSEASHEGRSQVPRMMQTKPFQMHKGSLTKIRLTRPPVHHSSTDRDSQERQSELQALAGPRVTPRIKSIKQVSLKSIVPRISSSIKVVQKPLSLVLKSSPQIKSRFASSERLRDKLFAQLIEVASADPGNRQGRPLDQSA